MEIHSEIKKLIKKVAFEGSSPVRDEEYWNVAGTRITVKKDRTLEIPIEEYWCTCSWHSIKTATEQDIKKECIYIKALKEAKKRLKDDKP